MAGCIGPILSPYLRARRWEVAHTLELPGRDARLANLGCEALSSHTRSFAKKVHPGGLYLHQKVAIEAYAQGANVCLATGTASGKTTLFHCAALEELVKDNQAKTLAVYPLRALTANQEVRWRNALDLSVKNGNAGRVDGGIAVKSRPGILRKSNVIIATPDILHAWLLPNAGEPSVQRFLAHLRLVILDEAHEYKGVFGSNAAFLIRRLRHLCAALGSSPRFVAASATIAKPEEHLRLVTGVDFKIVGELENGARQFEKEVLFLNTPPASDIPTCVPDLLKEIARHKDHRFIAFMDSRKQVELLTSIAARHDKGEDSPASDAPFQEDSAAWQDQLEYLQRLAVLPYRSGYEESDRQAIQQRLSSGSLSGIVSTSALELGIDIASLDVAVLVGSPATSTSLLQRIGRVGRSRPGSVLLINTGSVYDDAVFQSPNRLLSRPPAEGALYLENPRIQYIHAMCLARLGGEHDQVSPSGSEDAGSAVSSPVAWPPGFMATVEMERTGQIPPELQSMKSEAGETPHHVFPLRDVEQQFKVTFKDGPEVSSLGSISFSQCLREAYPGAVYRYLGRPYRVYKVSKRSREIQVRAEKAFVTKPNFLPTLIFPNLSPGNIFTHLEQSSLKVAECNLQVREWIDGFSEHRGPNSFRIQYPEFAVRANIFYDQRSFARDYFSSGVIVLHPCLNDPGVKADTLAQALLDALLLTIPFERTDVRAASDKLRRTWNGIPKGSNFLALYDSTYGSLRLSGRLADPDVLSTVLQRLPELIAQSGGDDPTLTAACSMSPSSMNEWEVRDVAERSTCTAGVSSGRMRVIAPGSIGALVIRDNEEFAVDQVYWNAKEGSVYYKGRLESVSARDPDAIVREPAEYVLEIPGLSRIALFDPETSELQEEPDQAVD